MLRIRFKTNAPDYRPVYWPVKHPYWCSGYDSEGNTILISYADNEDYIKKAWPEAFDLDSTEVDSYSFSSRFPRPQWLKEEETE